MGNSEQLYDFKQLLDHPKHNILVDIHSCPIERTSINRDDPAYGEYFTTVPRGIYVVLISDFGKNKIGEDNVQHQDREMYATPSWPWTGDGEVIRTAQIYFPGNTIFNPLMMFGQPGEQDANYDIFDVVTGEPASFNKSNKQLQGREAFTAYSRQVILAKLRGKQPKIVYIATCDPAGNKPSTWTAEQWNILIEERRDLQKKHRDIFKKFVETYPRRSARQQDHNAAGRSALGLSDTVDHDHYAPDDDSTTPLNITAVSSKDNTVACKTPCDYKKSCTNSIPIVGTIAKFCQNKYCTFENGETGECVDTERGKRSKKRRGGRRRTKKKRKRKTRKRRKKSRKRRTRKRRLRRR